MPQIKKAPAAKKPVVKKVVKKAAAPKISSAKIAATKLPSAIATLAAATKEKQKARKAELKKSPASKPSFADILGRKTVKFGVVPDLSPFKLGGVLHIKVGKIALALPSVNVKRNGTFTAKQSDLAQGRFEKLKAAELVAML